MTKPRPLQLPAGIPGALWLHSMPGRCESLQETTDWCASGGIDFVVCLVSDEEIAKKSPDYLAALRDGSFPVPVTRFPIPDYGVPEDKLAFAGLVVETVRLLRQGRRILVHCAAGIGRTGMFATAVLMAAGVERNQALALVRAAGSVPEDREQVELLTRLQAGLVRGEHKETQAEIVIGIDVGLSLLKPTSGTCCTGNAGTVIQHTFLDYLSRLLALGNPIGCDVLAIDGPVMPSLNYGSRACERIFTLGVFQRRCKPGLSNIPGTGQALRRGGLDTSHDFAPLVSAANIGAAFPRIIEGRNIVEAFPNAFLAVLLPDEAFQDAPRLGRGEKFDWLYTKLLEGNGHQVLRDSIEWEQRGFWEPVGANLQHDERAALICALTAIFVLRGKYVAVGEPVSGYFFLPPWVLWARWAKHGLDANRGNAGAMPSVEVWMDGICYSPNDQLPP